VLGLVRLGWDGERVGRGGMDGDDLGFGDGGEFPGIGLMVARKVGWWFGCEV